ncbi:hypothetical protein LUD23_30555, partial [Klebsiella pneumoniae]|uniref:hypothetical protein n=1 Tax=Klebsiella pneumoniae TaxID=573 RepID=UPI001E50DC37
PCSSRSPQPQAVLKRKNEVQLSEVENIFPGAILMCDASARALASHISIAPGKMFSTSDSWTSFFRFNTAWGWGEREEQG